jgi:hypothetical protein
VVSRGAPVSGPASCPARARQHAHAPRPFQDTHHTRARAHTHTHTHTHTHRRAAHLAACRASCPARTTPGQQR